MAMAPRHSSVQVRIPFCTRSRHQQRDAWIRLRGQIRRSDRPDAPYLLGHPFEPDRPALWNQWEDIYLLGQDGRMVWNVSLVTVRRACWNAVCTASEALVESRLNAEERAAEHARLRALFSRECLIPIPGTRMKEWRRPAPLKHLSLGGLTRNEAQEEEQRRLLKEDRPSIHEGWTLHHDYAYGIGVHAVVEADQLDADALAGFVERFRALGEKPYSSPTPATQFLPEASEKDTYGADWANANSRPVHHPRYSGGRG